MTVRPRQVRTWILSGAAALLLAAALGTAVPATAQASVCSGIQKHHYWYETIRKHGEPIARVWMHWNRRGTSSCTVLRALKWKGRPHYMFLRVCTARDRPNHGLGCSGWDAGLYRYYAGPIWHPQSWCQAIRVKVDSPGGRRVIDRWVSGPCD